MSRVLAGTKLGPWSASVALVAVIAGACSSGVPPGQGDVDGSADARPEAGAAGAPQADAEPIRCGASDCPTMPEQSTALEASACCTEQANTCGLKAPFAGDRCHELAQPGGRDASCPDFAISGRITLRGCCRPDGVCGAFDHRLGLGCISLTALGVVPRDGGASSEASDAMADARLGSCTFEPDNACKILTEVPCDGPEDCSGGKVCCGSGQGGPYERFECMESCDNPEAGDSSWFEICHPGQACQNPRYQCRTSEFLLPFLYRCYTDAADAADAADAMRAGSTARGEVNCGGVTCTAFESCCVRDPGEPYCVRTGQCRCISGSDAASEAGSDAAEG